MNAWQSLKSVPLANHLVVKMITKEDQDRYVANFAICWSVYTVALQPNGSVTIRPFIPVESVSAASNG